MGYNRVHTPLGVYPLYPNIVRKKRIRIGKTLRLGGLLNF